MDTVAERIKEKRKELGLTQEELAQRINTSRSAIGHWEYGLKKPEYYDTVIKLCKALQISPKWLFEGKEDTIFTQTSYSYPILKWGMVDQWMQSNNPIKDLLTDKHQYITSETEWSNKSFALKIIDKSMEDSLGQHSFSPDDIILVDTKIFLPASGDFIIVKNQDRIIFRQIFKEGNNWMLYALNMRYPAEIMTDKTSAIGIVRETRRHITSKT